MNLTLHLTENCNMDCAYCVHEKKPVRMSEAVVDAAVDLAFSTGKNAGLCFFGGEPLLESGLIYRAIRRCMLKTIETGKPAFYKMTTNGTLLMERFLENAHAIRMGIGLSFEGLAQDTCRRFKDGAPSFEIVEEKAAETAPIQAKAEERISETTEPQLDSTELYTAQFKEEFWALIHRQDKRMTEYGKLYRKYYGKVDGNEYHYLWITILGSTTRFKAWSEILNQVPSNEIKSIHTINALKQILEDYE